MHQTFRAGGPAAAQWMSIKLIKLPWPYGNECIMNFVFILKPFQTNYFINSGTGKILESLASPGTKTNKE